MSGYLIANYDIVDADAYRSYQQVSKPILPDGSKLLVLDDSSVRKEGEGGAQTVVIEYPSKEAALAAYESDEYQKIVGIRLGAIENGRAVIVGGFEMPAG